jgi:2-polyprenyl-3-methyl-5-hydroxy-6-metoxy-1,4-benzoquinol methylase
MGDQKNYFSHARPELVAALPAGDGNRVLDLGCGSGAMSQAIREQGKAAEIWGVEINPDAAAAAKQSGALTRVLEGDLEAVMGELPEGHFTHVIAGDVLEHLVNPWQALADLKTCMAPGAQFICSIPNIRNLSFILALLFKKRFEYRDSGVMDRTHLRFFARKDVHDLFAGAGFTDIHIGPIRPKKKLSWRLGKALLGDLVIKGFLITARLPKS